MNTMVGRIVNVVSTASLAAIFIGCGGGGAETKPDAPVVKFDTAPLTRLDSAGPDAIATGGSHDASARDTMGTGGTGGTTMRDAGPDVSGPMDTAPDSPQTNPSPDTRLPGPDGGLSDAPDGPLVDANLQGDASGWADGSSLDTQGPAGPNKCQAPSFAQQIGFQAFPKSLAIDKEGWGITAGHYWPNPSDPANPPRLGSKALTNLGSSDVFIARMGMVNGKYDATWVFTAPGADDQEAWHVAASSDGMVGAAGTFTGTMEVGPVTITNATAAPVNYVLGLHGANGTGAWAKKVNLGTGLLGTFSGNVKQPFFVLCASATTSLAELGITTPNAGGRDAVIAAFNAQTGAVLWARMLGGAANQTCETATVTDSGDVIASGQYTGTLDLGQGALVPAPTSANDRLLWVAKLNGLTGATVLARSFGATGIIKPNLSESDAQGNIAVAGTFQTSFTVGPTTLVPTGPYDVFVLKLSGTDLSPLFTRRWGASQKLQHYSVSVARMAFDSAANLTVSGGFIETIDLVQGGTRLTAISTPGTDIYLAKLDGNTGETLCARQYGAPSISPLFSDQQAWGLGINRWATDSNKDFTMMVGEYYGTLDFGPPTTPLGGGSTAGIRSSFLLTLAP